MTDNTINVRIKQKIDTESNWSKNNPVLLKGEKGLIEGTGKYKIGNGTSKWSDLSLYEGMTASDRSKLNSIASGATKVTVDSALSSTSTNPVQNKVINSALAGKSNTNHTHDLSTMINTLSTGTATPTDEDYYISQYSSGGTTTTTYHRRPMKALFEYIKGKLSTVAVSGSYNDLSNKPTIPTVGNGTVTIKQAGTNKGTFTMNQSGNTTIELTDNNTTYSTGTSSTSGLTKLYTGTGTATDGTMTQAAIKGALDGKSDSSHLHSQYYDSKISRTKNTVLAAPNGSDGGAVFRKLEASDLPGTYAGSSTAGGAAISANKINPTVTFTCGDNNNTTGYRLIATVSLGKWSNYRATFITCSRHQGYGFISIGFGCNNSTISQANGYAEIKYYGLTSSASVISKDAFQIYISADGTKAYVFWKYWDYSSCDIIILKSDFTISNGTWMTGISSDYGVRKAQIDINTASSADSVPWSGITGKPSTFTPSSHTHDDRYYTESEVDSKLNGKANTSHTHTISQITDIANASVKTATTATTAQSVEWNNVKNKPSTYAPSSHNHNYAGSASAGGAANSANILNNYFGTTRQASADIDLTNSTYANRVSYMMATSSMTTGKPPSDAHVLTFGWDTTAGWGAQLALGDGSGTHMYVRGADSKNNKSVYGNWKTMLDSENYNSYAPSKTGSGASGTWGISVTGNATTATKLSSSAGSANQPVYFSDGKPVAGTYTLGKSVPSDAKFTDTVYTHPTTSGNKHIPSGGSAGQILRWSADGTAVWGADNNTTYNDATTSARGLMTAAMVTKLNGIATNANNYSLPTASSSTLGGVKTTSTVTETSGYSPCPIVSGVPYYRNPLAQKEYTLSNISGTLAVSKGGTGATSASTGRANLGAVNFVCQKTEPEDGDQNVGDLWFAEE